MERTILSLKNIYRLLTADNYCINSCPVIGRTDRRGMTLSRFWQENLIYELRSGRCGKRIWRGGSGQNRYESELCNRSGRLPYYTEYAQELARAINAQLLLKQLRQLQKSLQFMNYNRELLARRLEVFVRLCEQEDMCFQQAGLEKYIRAALEVKAMEAPEEKWEEFRGLWTLTILLLHALAGEAMDSGEMRGLRQQPDMSFDCLLRLYGEAGGEEYSSAIFLTNRLNEICTTPLSPEHFFGRERELFELRQMVSGGGKYILSGMGGIGKTELLRQLLQCCEEEQLADYICVIQYEQSVEESFSQAFSLGGKGVSAKDNFREALAIIQQHAEERVLVLVDNMNRSAQEDSALQELLGLDATVMMTTRRAKLEGWTDYPVTVPTQQTAELIFRDHYGRALSSEEKLLLGRICKEAGWCHTLVVRLMGRAARSRGWSLEQLAQQLQGSETRLTWQEGESIVQLHQIYQQLYTINQFPREWNGIIRLLALLPYRNYEEDFLRKYLVEKGQEELLREILTALSAAGWLEQDGGAYSMHPLIAECILTKKPRLQEAEGFLRRGYYTLGRGLEPEQLWEDLDRQYDMVREADAEQLELADIMIAVGDKTSGGIEDGHMDWLLAAIILRMYNASAGKENWERYVKRCRQVSERREIVFQIHGLLIHQGNMRVMQEIWEQQQNRRTVGDILYSAMQLTLGEQLTVAGKAEEAAPFIDQAAKSKSKMLQIMYHDAKALEAWARSDMPEVAKWCKKLLIYLHKEDIDDPKYEFGFLHLLCDASGGMGQWKEMKECLQKMEALLDQVPQAEQEITYHVSASIYESSLGNHEKALSHMECAWKNEKEYRPNTPIEYATVASQYALMLNRAGKHEKAVELYQEAINAYAMPEGEKNRIYNNLAVAYLDWGKPREAIEALEPSYAIGEKLGGLAVAEPANNLARAYGMLGDQEKELTYLQEATPLLEQGYGPEHPKVIKARERLSALTAC